MNMNMEFLELIFYFMGDETNMTEETVECILMELKEAEALYVKIDLAQNLITYDSVGILTLISC